MCTVGQAEMTVQSVVDGYLATSQTPIEFTDLLCDNTNIIGTTESIDIDKISRYITNCRELVDIRRSICHYVPKLKDLPGELSDSIKSQQLITLDQQVHIVGAYQSEWSNSPVVLPVIGHKPSDHTKTNSHEKLVAFLKSKPTFLIRDCRNDYYHYRTRKNIITRPPAADIKETYLALAANHARAALNLTKISNNPDSNKEQQKQICEFLREAIVSIDHGKKVSWRPAIKTLNHKLLKSFQDNDLKFNGQTITNLQEALVQSRDYYNLKDTQPHIITISNNLTDKGKPRYNVEASIRLDPLSDEIRKDYSTIKDSISGTNRQDSSAIELPDWYNKLSNIEQVLLKDNIDHILNGKTIFSELVNLPGLRNAYAEVLGNTENQELKETKTIFRTAFSHTSQEDYKKYNIQHLKTLVVDKKIAVNMLDNEGVITNRIKQAVEKIKNTTAGEDESLIPGGFNDNNIPLSGKIPDNKLLILLVKILTILITIITLGYGRNWLINKTLHNAKGQRIEQPSHLTDDKTIQVYTCKSGKDRTGMAVCIVNIDNTISTLLPKDENKMLQDENKISQTIMNTCHQETLAGGVEATVDVLALQTQNIFTGINIKLAPLHQKIRCNSKASIVSKYKKGIINKR